MISLVHKSHEQKLITKHTVATHTILFKLYVYSSTLVIKPLQLVRSYNVVLRKNSYCNTIGQSSFINFTTCMACSLFETEVLRFVSNVQLVKVMV